MRTELKKYAYRKFRHYPKTREVSELRDELYSMMCDKYDDCIASGMTEAESFESAKALMNDCKSAVREVELNSSMGGLRKKLVDMLALSAALMLTLSVVYLFLSLIIFNSFDKTWLIPVTGAFAYVVFFAVSIFSYARRFRFERLERMAFGMIFVSFVPPIYALPGLIETVFYDVNIWSKSWVVVPVIAFLYLLADTIMYSKNQREYSLGFAAAGFALATVIFLVLSVFFGKWNVAWLIYIVYLAAVSFMIYFAERRKIKD